MLAFCPPPKRRGVAGKPSFAAWSGFNSDAAAFLASTPHAFLFGAIFDRMVEANQAWLAPYQLYQRLGHLDLHRLAAMRDSELASFIGRHRGEPALHRFPPTMAKAIVSASRRLIEHYGGDAARVWGGGASVAQVLDRLRDFKGISDKIAHMTVRLLVTHYGVRLAGWEDIDVAVDRHVARVFLRTGLVGGDDRGKQFKTATRKREIVSAARRLNPDFPGALDEPAFFIGKGWCNANRAWCVDGERPCPLSQVCPRNRTDWSLV